jgi:tRNA-2-methylthio-N6-dimethylallyladenosine synthase
MRRRYTTDDYRQLVDRLRDSRPDLAITTDLIVGFPGETDAEFEDTLGLVRDIGFTDSFIFKYSPRPNTAAAQMEGSVAADVAQQRLEQLQDLQRLLTLAAHRNRLGERTQVLVEGVSRRGGRQRYGRDPYNRVVNFSIAADDSIEQLAEPGQLLEVDLVDATPHSLIGEPVLVSGRGAVQTRQPQTTQQAMVEIGAGTADGTQRDIRVR